MKGSDYLNHFALPNFYFHLTVAYSILRQCGVDIGKRNFLGAIQCQPIPKLKLPPFKRANNSHCRNCGPGLIRGIESDAPQAPISSTAICRGSAHEHSDDDFATAMTNMDEGLGRGRRQKNDRRGPRTDRMAGRRHAKIAQIATASAICQTVSSPKGFRPALTATATTTPNNGAKDTPTNASSDWPRYRLERQ